MSVRARLTGGYKISYDVAVELRQLCFGSAAAPPRGEWTRTALIFPLPNMELSFGLRCPRNGTRGLQSVLEAYIIKYFLFNNRTREKSCPIDQLLKLQESDQSEALWSAMAEILWGIGEKSKATVVIPSEVPHIVHSHKYFQDTVTEKLNIFDFTSLDDLQIFLKRYLTYFTEDSEPGALLLLYSAVLTRTLAKIRTDLDGGGHLLGPHEEGSLNIITLLMTGRATPYLHNGVIYVGDEDHYALPQFGVLARSTIGLLVYEGDDDVAQSAARQPGSRLKTPAIPIWVTSCIGHYGVIFNSNRELLRNYHAEKRFELHYYTCAGCYISLTVDNRAHETGNANKSVKSNLRDKGESSAIRDNDINSTPLERLIHTKWKEAKITIQGPGASIAELLKK